MAFNNLAAAFLALSGLLHIAAPLVGGIASQTIMLTMIGVIYLVLAFMMVATASRVLSWIVFFMMILGGIASMVLYNSGVVPNWVSIGIFRANWASALCLLVVLWRKPINAA